MSYNWIKAEDFTMDTFLLFDQWVIRYIMNENPRYKNGTRNYISDMAKALSRYPYVITFCKRKAPECTEEYKKAETAILSALETFVVYAYLEVMEQVNYIRNWNPQLLYNLADLSGKIVLDVGSGTGRLAFAAAKYAKHVYASEPCDVLREYMCDKIKKNNVMNMKVLDGEAMNLPYEDNTFDIEK